MAFQTIFSSIQPSVVNCQLLGEQAAAQFGTRFFAVDCGDSRGLAVNLNTIIEGDVALWDSVVAAHDGTQQTADQQLAGQKATDFSDLDLNVAGVLSDAATAINNINTDLIDIANDIASFTAASTLAAAKPSLLNAMQIEQSILNRQKRIIQSLIYAVKVIRWLRNA